MADCKKCLHAPVCEKRPKMPGAIVVGCDDFKDRTKWVERPKGQWVGEADGYADGELVYDVWYCSECNYCIDDGTDDPDMLPNFCPSCGADMREKKTDEEADHGPA